VRILVLDEEFPYPLNTGKRIRSFNLLSRLAARHNLRYVAYGETASEAHRALIDASMQPVAVDPRVPAKAGIGFYARLAMNLFSPDPYIVASHYSVGYQTVVDRQVTGFVPDVVLCEWTPYARYIKRLHGTCKVIATHNVEARIWQRYYEHEHQPFRRWYIGVQWRKVQKFERTALAWIDGLTAVSAADRDEFLRERPALPTSVIDNGVDLDYFRSSRRSPDSAHLVFTGSMDWRPNQDAATYFVHEMLPLLRRRVPDAKVTFVGRNPPEHIRALGNRPGVRITGTVDDVRPYIDSATVYVVPLRIGGGSRLKILEAMAMKRAVVSTTVGAEGLNVADGTNILLADTPTTFIDAVCGVLADRERANRLGCAGRELVEACYGWDPLAQKLEQFLCEVVAHRKAGEG